MDFSSRISVLNETDLLPLASRSSPSCLPGVLGVDVEKDHCRVVDVVRCHFHVVDVEKDHCHVVDVDVVHSGHLLPVCPRSTGSNGEPED